MRIAVVAVFAGLVERGVENLAWYFKKLLPFETKVFSVVDTEWTSSVPFQRINKWHTFVRLCKKSGFYRILYQFEKINPYFDVFSEDFLDGLSFCRNLETKFLEFNPDIILNLSGSTVGYFLSRYKRKTNAKFISIACGRKSLSEIKNARTRPDIFSVSSPSFKEYIEERVSNVTVGMVPYAGVDLDIFSSKGKKFSNEELKAMSKLSNDSILERPFVLSTSALEDYKSLDRLIYSMAKIKKGTLIFVGDGSKKDYLISLASQFLGKRFVYVGVLGKKDIHKIYNSCDIFCLPNIGEQFGCVFLEAMAAGLPVVADNDEDKRWLIGDGGLLVNVQEIDNIAAGLHKAMTIDWQDRPRKQAEKFSWGIVMGQYEQLIRGLF